jgi:hypothetical protein
MAEHQLEPELCLKIRHYIIHQKKMMREGFYKGVLQLLSPSVQGEVAQAAHSHWINSLPYFCVKDPMEMASFTAAIATKLSPQAFIPNAKRRDLHCRSFGQTHLHRQPWYSIGRCQDYELR